MLNQTNLASRIGVRGVVAGILTSSALMLLFMSFIAALGLWNFRIREIFNLDTRFWVSTCIAWSISLFIGGFMAASGAKAETTSEGVFNSLAACSGTFLLLIITILYFTPTGLMILLHNASQSLYAKGFTVGFIGLVFGVLGGVAGARFEQHSSFFERERLF